MSKKTIEAAAAVQGAVAPSAPAADPQAPETTGADDATDAPADADADAEAQANHEHPEAAALRELLVRNGLKTVWLLDSGPCFSEAHARHVAGDDFDSLTVISAE